MTGVSGEFIFDYKTGKGGIVPNKPVKKQGKSKAKKGVKVNGKS